MRDEEARDQDQEEWCRPCWYVIACNDQARVLTIRLNRLDA